MATYDEASACYECGNTGELVVTREFSDGSKLLTFYCRNKACEWNDTPWNVTVRSDGSIPDANMSPGEKTYVGFETDDAEAKRLIAQLEEMSKQSLQGRVDPKTGLHLP